MLPAYAHGSITGAGPHNGVRLVLAVWPNIHKIRVGQKVHLQIIGHATSSSSGSYTIRSTVVLPKGIHNLEILARSSTARGAFAFPRKVVRRGRSLVAVAVNGSASTRPVSANIHMMALPKSEQSPSRQPSLPVCPNVAIKMRELGQKLVTVGGLYSELADGATQETYTAGSNTTISIGIGISGDLGSFSAAGTFTQTISGSEPFPVLTDEQVHEQTPYAFGLYKVCGMSEVLSEGWATGRHEVHANAPGINFNNCGENLGPHLGFTRKSGTAGTFKAGVAGVFKVIGINLSAQSGYTKQVSIKYTVGSTGGFMCGSNGLPPKASFDVLSPCNATTCVPGIQSVRADRRRSASDTGRVQSRRTRSSR